MKTMVTVRKNQAKLEKANSLCELMKQYKRKVETESYHFGNKQ